MGDNNNYPVRSIRRLRGCRSKRSLSGLCRRVLADVPGRTRDDVHRVRLAHDLHVEVSLLVRVLQFPAGHFHHPVVYPGPGGHLGLVEDGSCYGRRHEPLHARYYQIDCRRLRSGHSADLDGGRTRQTDARTDAVYGFLGGDFLGHQRVHLRVVVSERGHGWLYLDPHVWSLLRAFSELLLKPSDRADREMGEEPVNNQRVRPVLDNRDHFPLDVLAKLQRGSSV